MGLTFYRMVLPDNVVILADILHFWKDQLEGNEPKDLSVGKYGWSLMQGGRHQSNIREATPGKSMAPRE